MMYKDIKLKPLFWLYQVYVGALTELKARIRRFEHEMMLQLQAIQVHNLFFDTIPPYVTRILVINLGFILIKNVH